VSQPFKQIDIIVPFLNEAESVVHFAEMSRELAEAVKARFNLETCFILVDDGSSDDSVMLFEKHMQGSWKLLSFSRNFGKETAILAGLDHSDGDYVLLMDADLQHTTDVALDMISRLVADPDLDMVYAVRASREDDRLLTRWFAGTFYRIMNMGQRYEIPENAGDFRVMTKRFAAAMRQLRDRKRFNKGLYAWTGFRQERIEYMPAARFAGQTKWSKRKLLAFSVEGFTSFSVVPLRILSIFGASVAILGFTYGIKIILEVLFSGIAVPGYPSLMVAILVLGGLNLALVGLVGEYVWAALSEAKHRPNYILKSVSGPAIVEQTPTTTQPLRRELV
jgi:glycosyltransferase involved in cell wall biosynthesis